MIDRGRTTWAAIRTGSLAFAALLLFVGTCWPAPQAAAASTAKMAGSIDGRVLSTSSPIKLHAGRPTELRIDLTNAGSRPLTVRTVRLQGAVLGLTFFSFSTAVDLRVAPGATESRRFTLDLGDLEGQATGLMPAAVKLLDDQRHDVADQHFTADVDGSIWSVYGLFGFTAMLLTVVTLLGVLLALARQCLPFNRALRGLRFAVVGLAFGVAAVFVLSVLRVMIPSTSRWLPILLITTGIAFAIGYLTPTPDDPDPTAAYESDPQLDEEFRDSVSGSETIRRPVPPG